MSEPRVSEEGSKPTLFTQTVEGARTHLVALTTYLASLVALVGGHHLLVKKLEHTTRDALFFASIPLLLSLLCITLPAWLKRRREAKLKYFGIHGKLEDPGYFLLRPYEVGDRERFHRPDGAEDEILEWIRQGSEPLLYLTGRSGTGKSSLLDASVLPKLKEGTESAFQVISVRSYRDPTDELRKVLCEPGRIWKSPPDDDLRQLLEKATLHLRPKRLLVVVDQFEELLILHDDEGQHAFLELLHSVSNDLIPGLCVLLVARSDYLGRIAELNLSTLETHRTWVEICPFTAASARVFLENSGLGLDPTRMDDLMEEASEIEENRGQIRPITLNLFGMVLSRQGSRQMRSRRLLRDYLAEALDQNELRVCSRQILRCLITEVGTKKPKSEGELAQSADMPPTIVRGGLLRLGNLGLVRRIDRGHFRN